MKQQIKQRSDSNVFMVWFNGIIVSHQVFVKPKTERLNFSHTKWQNVVTAEFASEKNNQNQNHEKNQCSIPSFLVPNMYSQEL
jgi:hypothetical protein